MVSSNQIISMKCFNNKHPPHFFVKRIGSIIDEISKKASNQ